MKVIELNVSHSMLYEIILKGLQYVHVRREFTAINHVLLKYVISIHLICRL